MMEVPSLTEVVGEDKMQLGAKELPKGVCNKLCPESRHLPMAVHLREAWNRGIPACTAIMIRQSKSLGRNVNKEGR